MVQAQPKSKKDTTVEVVVHPNWVALISYCDIALRNGLLVFNTQAAIPIKLSRQSKEKIVFGKDNVGTPLFVKEINEGFVTVRVTKKWRDLVDFCRDSFPYGQVGVMMAKGEPYKPVEQYTLADINFGHPESFPRAVRFLNQITPGVVLDKD